MTLSGPDDTVWSGARRIDATPSSPPQPRSRRLCGLSGWPAGPGAWCAGPPPASGGFSLVRALRPRSCPRFLARFRPRLPLSPPTKVPGHRPGLSMYWQYGCDHQVVHPADARERGSRGSTHHGSTSSSIGDVPQHVKTNPHLQADWSRNFYPGGPSWSWRSWRSGSEVIAKVLSVRRGPLTRATSC